MKQNLKEDRSLLKNAGQNKSGHKINRHKVARGDIQKNNNQKSQKIAKQFLSGI